MLLVRCCQWNFASANPNPAKILGGVEWDQVLLLARRHRVQGLVWNALAQHADRIPADVKEALSADARSIAATNLAIAGECRALQAAFSNEGLPLLFLKGLTVGALAYRSPLLKMGWDIDLLINPNHLIGASRLLVERGYEVRIPGRKDLLPFWHARRKESVWSRDGCLHVELHTRLSDNPLLIPRINVRSSRQEVAVAEGLSLSTLAEDQLFSYLAVHGASSAWFRLKWISDFAALIHGQSSDELERLYRVSQELGAERAIGQALLLADALFNSMNLAPALRKQLQSERMTVWLMQAALRLMTNGIREPTTRPLGTLAIHWTQFFLKAGLAFKWSELARQFTALLKR